jgi:Flp pilus assembly protein CpaB
MATTATTARTNGQRASEEPGPGKTRGIGRHRQMPLVVVGVLLVLGCALAFTDASLHLGSREEVLVVAQPVAAGQVLTSTDLRAAQVSTGSGLDVVLSGQEATVVGRRAAVALVAGSLLTTSEVGSAPRVGAGFDVVAVGLKPGAYPPELAPGDRVQIVPVTSSSSSGGTGTSGVTSGSPVGATVLSIETAPSDSDNPTVFSLQVSTSDAYEVASLAAAGQASLVEVGAGT